jgi:hypothetical protein
LEAAQQRLEAIIKAIPVVRRPLERFYGSLSDEQRQRFNTMAVATKEGQQSRPTSSANDLTALCRQQSGSFANLSVQRIERVVQPDPQQQSAFDSLKNATEGAATSLQSSCPTATPQSPMARLDAVEGRLSAMVNATKSIHPALENFYASLSDEQKAKFNMMGPPPKTNSSQR